MKIDPTGRSCPLRRLLDCWSEAPLPPNRTGLDLESQTFRPIVLHRFSITGTENRDPFELNGFQMAV